MADKNNFPLILLFMLFILWYTIQGFAESSQIQILWAVLVFVCIVLIRCNKARLF